MYREEKRNIIIAFSCIILALIITILVFNIQYTSLINGDKVIKVTEKIYLENNGLELIHEEKHAASGAPIQRVYRDNKNECTYIYTFKNTYENVGGYLVGEIQETQVIKINKHGVAEVLSLNNDPTRGDINELN